MTIRKELKTLTPEEWKEFIAERRRIRNAHIFHAIARNPKKQSVAKLATDLGLPRHEVAKRIEHALAEKDNAED